MFKNLLFQNAISNKLLIKNEEKTIQETQNDFANKLITYHTNYLKKQEQLKQEFDYKKIKQIDINIWDDFYDDNKSIYNNETENNIQTTFAYVETSNIPNIENQKILSKLINVILENSLLPKDVDMELSFYDASTKYPILVLENQNFLYKRWQIEFKNITHEILDKLIEDLKKIDIFFNEVKFNIYSES